MNIKLNETIADNYVSSAQKIRVMTEDWVDKNMFCPCCGNMYVSHFENNRPVADFFCSACEEEFELKSKGTAIGRKINDGAYETMINRITSFNNPNFFFMQYNKRELSVENFIIVPKHFFSAEMIEKRKPLADTARRAGWVGCNIIMERIPDEGRIYIIENNKEIPVDQVVNKVKKTGFMKEYKLDARGWIIDILNCVNQIEDRTFTLKQMYMYEDLLAAKHPDNHHVKDKIRQQLQVLRDNGLIEFLGNGNYRKI